MKRLITTIQFIIISIVAVNGQIRKIDTINHNGERYYVYPYKQQENSENSFYGFSNGASQIRKKYRLKKDTNIDGQWIELYKNSEVKISKIFQIKEDKINGECLYYYPNGQLEEIINYNLGNYNGWRISWYESGSIKDSTKYLYHKGYDNFITNRVFHKSWYENGNLKEIESYDEDGAKNGKWINFYKNGNPKKISHYSNKGEKINLEQRSKTNSYGYLQGLQIRYHENGQIKDTLNYKENYRNGKNRQYYPNGQIKFDGKYQSNRKNGLWITYYSNGQMKQKGELIKGKPIGKWKEWYENGQLKNEGQYKTDKYTFCAFIPSERTYQYKSGDWNYYYSNGQLKAKGKYEIDEKTIRVGGCNAVLTYGKIKDNWQAFNEKGEQININDLLDNGEIENIELILSDVIERNLSYEMAIIYGQK